MEMQPSATLNAKQEQVAVLLASGCSIKGAAEKAEAGERTVHTWLEDPTFRDRVTALRAAIVERAVGCLASASTKAAVTLAKLLDDEDPSIRLRAATAILTSMSKLRDHTEMEARMVELEQQLRGAK
jgi:HEAT repeat protein